MANLSNTLYPPIVSTFMPSFVNGESAVIYYTISNFNTATNIYHVHVSLRNQKNNLNCFVDYPSGIWITGEPVYDSTKGMYKVTIPAAMVSNEEDGKSTFNINTYYKVQLRFDCYDGLDYAPNESNDSNNEYLINCQDYFSEWSSVCLIRPIDQPNVYLNRLDNVALANYNRLSKVIQPIVGKFYFGSLNENSTETETIESYQFSLLSTAGEVIKTYSKVYTAANLNPNSINTQIDLTSPSLAGQYVLRIDYTTKNQYSSYKTYDIEIEDYADTEEHDWYSDVKIVPEVDTENGLVKLSIDYSSVALPSGGVIHVRRTSSESAFTEWETIADYNGTEGFKKTILDYTVNSMIWYKYSVYFESASGAVAEPKNSAVVYPNFENCMIYSSGRQLKLKYNYKISSFKHVVNRAKIDTLGGKYPRFAENAILNYKQFSISGTLTGMMDLEGNFYDRESYFTSIDSINNTYYKKYLDANVSKRCGYGLSSNQGNDSLTVYVDLDTYNHNDVFWEREFREETIKWLNNGEPKLYRSPTEGLMVIMLTDISLTPSSILGRRIWDFSATAYEVADGSSLSKLSTLGIFEIPAASVSTEVIDGGNSEDSSISTDNSIAIPGQLYEFTPASAQGSDLKVVSNNIISTLKKLTVGIDRANNPGESIKYYLTDVKIYFSSKPEYYKNSFKETGTSSTNMIFQKVDVSTNKNINTKNLFFGYSFDVAILDDSKSVYQTENKNIFVNARGYYQFPSDVKISEIYIPYGTTATIEYVLHYERTGYSVSGSSGTTTKVGVIAGQYFGTLNPDSTTLGDSIKEKYTKVFDDRTSGTTTIQQVLSWGGLIFDVDPYSVFKIRHTGESTYYDTSEVTVGATGYLNLNKEYNIQDIMYCGRLMFLNSAATTNTYLSNNQFILDSKYGDADNIYFSTSYIKNPKNNVVYSTTFGDFIYYNDSWENFEYNDTKKTGIIKLETSGAINYLASIVKTVSGGDI